MTTKRITAKVERTKRNGFAASLADPRHRPKVVQARTGYRRKPRTPRDAQEESR